MVVAAQELLPQGCAVHLQLMVVTAAVRRLITRQTKVALAVAGLVAYLAMVVTAGRSRLILRIQVLARVVVDLAETAETLLRQGLSLAQARVVEGQVMALLMAVIALEPVARAA